MTFARVITARTGEHGFDDLINSAKQELPSARRRPGFAGYLLLTDDITGNALIISFWETRADMEAVAHGSTSGIHNADAPTAVLRSLKLANYEVAVQA